MVRASTVARLTIAGVPGAVKKTPPPERAETPPFGLSAGEAAENLTGAQQPNRDRLGAS